MQEQSKAAILASKYINSTNRNIFLTGKAGTGKTTFLREVVRLTHKNMAVAAPTGIAAINAGGVTLHSLFQLPFGIFVPDSSFTDTGGRTFGISTPASIMRDIKMHVNKRNMLRELELLVIDEVSMLRADMLDAIDTVLRSIRRQHQRPFGGVQVLFIGDLQQLPPVTKEEEWSYLKNYYHTAFFFESQILRQFRPLYVELDKVYRQSDPTFISILNNLRDNRLTPEDVRTLNTHYKPDFVAGINDGYVNLTTHNYKADSINAEELQKNKNKIFRYEAEITGDFKENIYPIDRTIELKEGAQVMFIKNDPDGKGRFFNGKIGKISTLTNECVTVSFSDGSPPVDVSKYTWENKRYTLNEATNRIEEKIIGTFVHLPLKLAWAITVHKSQGLTFERAIIDVSQAFAAGQVYVALSRLTSLDGLVLSAPIQPHGIDIDMSLIEYASTKESCDTLQTKLQQATKEYIANEILRVFDLSILYSLCSEHVASYTKDEARSVKQQSKKWAQRLLHECKDAFQIADKFSKQLRRIVTADDANYLTTLNERLLAAKKYFEPILTEFTTRVGAKIQALKSEKQTKTFATELKDLETAFRAQNLKIAKACALVEATINKTELTKAAIKETAKDNTTPKKEKEKEKEKTDEKTDEKQKKPKISKSDSQKLSVEMFTKGMTIEAIAQERNYAVSTIETHLAESVGDGQLEVSAFVSQEKTDKIRATAKDLDTIKLAEIKETLGDDYSYRELKFAMAEKILNA